MKRKIALLLAAVMTTAMLPMNAVASSTNQVSKKATVQKDDPVSPSSPVCLKIYPKDTVESYSSIILKVDNGKFDIEEWNDNGGSDYFYGGANFAKDNSVYNTAFNDYVTNLKGGLGEREAIANAVQNIMASKTNYLPYSLRVTSKSEMEVTLFPVLEADTDNTTNNLTTQGKVCYNIALPIVASDEGDIKVTIDDNETSISGGGTYTIATATTSNGSTTTTIDADDVDSFEGTLNVGDITIKEDVAGTFDSKSGNGTIKLKLNSGFVFADTTGYVDPGTNCASEGKSFDTIKLGAANFNDKMNQIVFNIPDEFKGDTSKACSIVISGLTVQADDDDEDWGDVNLTVSGNSITTDTIKIGTRADYGFYMKAVEEPTLIISGQSYFYNDDLDSEDFQTAELMFGETIADTWLTQRKLEFTVPEGVKILGYEIDDTDNIKISDGDFAFGDYASITNDGKTLRLDGLDDDKNTIERDDCTEFGISFYVSVASTFEGDIDVSVAGAGLAADTLDPVTVATVKAPVTVETTATKANMGYQAMDTSDIVITESVAGALLEDKTVAIALDSSYGSDEIGFADDDLEIAVEGELDTDEFKIGKGYFGLEASSDTDGLLWKRDEVVDGSITFKVDDASYTEPSTITISNVKIGTTRSVPYGSYDLKVGDEAVINNYSEDTKSISKVTDDMMQSEDPYLACFDSSDADAVYCKGYLSIATETGTLDGKVEVTIGETSILMNGESVEMDTAAYIQTTSNSTMVPLRFVALAIGVDQANANSADESSKIMWDATTKTATILYAAGSGQKIIQFTAGSPIMVVDGTPITMENGVVAEITDDRMFVPFRALGTALGVSVSWDAETRTAIYNA